jgi:uncharacterized protein (TIGR02246 family)
MSGPSTTVDPIDGLLERLFDAWNHRDVAAFARLFADDADYVTGAGEWWRERRIIEVEIARRFAEGERSGTVRLAGHSIRRLTADVAVIHAAWDLSTPGEEVRRGLASLVVLRGPDGAWRIASLHNTDVAAEES